MSSLQGKMMALNDHELARHENGSLQIRTAPMRLRWELGDLISSDGHRLRCALSCSVRAIDRPAEQRLMAEVFLAQSLVATAEKVIAHFQSGFRTAGSAAVQKQPAEHWLGDGQKSELAEVFRAAGHRIAFGCGLEVLAPFEVQLSSPTVEQQRVEAMQRTLAERRFEGQLEHFNRAAQLLKQFEELRQNNPGLTPSDLLKQISPADQGAMLQMLMLAKGRAARASTLWAVAGSNLVKIETAPPKDVQNASREAKPSVTPLPPDLGPLRSVQPGDLGGKPVLLVGARSGVMVVDSSNLNDAIRYRDSTTSQLGFSRVIAWKDELWACHSEAGLVAWRVGQEKPRLALRPTDLPIPPSAAVPPSSPLMTMSTSIMRPDGAAPGARNLQALDDDRAVYSSGCALLVTARDGTSSLISAEHRSEIIAVLPEGERVAVVHEDGMVELRRRDTLVSISQTRAAGRLTAAAMMPWLGASRLLLATAEGPVFCVAPDDLLVTQYLSTYRGLRAIVAADDVIAAISPDRQRLVLWNPWDPQRPAADIALFPIARHRLADVDLG